ncbi:response regulator [Nitrospirillum sp. BR 11164]|uniref:response regulator n=1 Tax=Nitrospirillum sp. BR 11164 TaxID=3104324 RepID=UPI002AFF2009|nr:HD domain-containing phosphohydrolase [Nitrospirillum sp. BR 11164]MEA1650307.1 response regulator [Nitrospirillum sp. BR 11164]
MDKLWKVLVVDDEAVNLHVLRDILSANYALVYAKSGQQALDAARRHRPDLILLDIMMPDMDGYEVCRRLKAEPELRHIPIIFVSAMGTVEDEAKGFEAGATDYLTKPISAALVRARVRTHIALVDQASILDRLCVAGEYKDQETGGHVRRIGLLAEALARALGWSEDACRAIRLAAPMHDIGKIAIPDRILLKNGKLDAEEMAIMRTHPERGAAIIGSNGSSLLRLAASIAMTHHEKWDGSGYPRGLTGTAIPLEGRIVALVDVYDALLSPRPYKPAWSLEAVAAYLEDQAGCHFDPVLVPLFLEMVAATGPQVPIMD